MIKYATVISILLVMAFGKINAQSIANPSDLQKIIPPSPTPASIGKYAEWPVSLFTGTPSITIPLYELKSRSLSVPIALNYHASGIRVGEIASWVGLGWSLDAGGVITRSVRGIADENPYGGYMVFRKKFPNAQDLTMGTSTDDFIKMNGFLNQASQGAWDTQPDLFMFNAMGRSFKFYFNSKDSIITQPYSKVRLTVDFPGRKFTAVLENGTKLVFGGADATETTNGSFSSVISGANSFPSSWYLKNIISADGETITFNYKTHTILHNTNFSETDYLPYVKTTSGIVYNTYVPCASCGAQTPRAKQLNMEYQQVYAYSIASIESDMAIIYFDEDASPRLDQPGDAALSRIRVFSKLANSFIKEFRFTYTFSQATGGTYTATSIGQRPEESQRLKLMGIQEYSAGGDSKSNEWKFEYNPLALPPRSSFAQDHWGYFNGASANQTLLPAVAGFTLPAHPSGDREPNASFSQAEMLTKITYPTGGSSMFTYEQNAYVSTQPTIIDNNIVLRYDLDYGSADQVTQKTASFDITNTQNVPISISGVYSSNYIQAHPSCASLPAASLTGPVAANIFICNSGTAIKNVILTPGHYVLSFNRDLVTNPNDPNHSSVFVRLSYQSQGPVENVNKYVGGVRVNKIEYADNITANIVTQSFQYENPFLIAAIDNATDYISNLSDEQRTGSGAGCAYYAICFQNIYVRSSASKYSLGSVQGGIIGYGKVTNLFGANGANGRTVSYFSTRADFQPALARIFPFPPATSRDWGRGLLLQKETYSADGKKISAEFNTYSQEEKDFLTTYKMAIDPVYRGVYTSDGTLRPGVIAKPYDIITEQTKLLQSVQKNYSATGEEISATTNYFYDNPNNLSATRIETTDSKGNVAKTINRTPLEKAEINSITPLNAEASSAIDTMIAKNMISPVLQQDKFSGATFLTRSQTNYKIWNPNTVAPQEVRLQQGNKPAEIRLQLHAYDAFGNLTEQSKTDDVHEVFVYGYKNQYPVAKIVNTTPAIVKGLVNQTILDNVNGTYTDQQVRDELNRIRTGLANTKAMVTTYTYTPLIGIASETDPTGKTTFYEYDNFNRLKNIKDYQGNIIKNFQYNYANSCGPNCVVLPMQTMNGSNTIGYPVGVFNVNNQLLGNATTQAQYITMWNANAANQVKGVLSAGADALKFNLTLAVNQTAPTAVTGLRYYQFDCDQTSIDAIRSKNAEFIDFGDGITLRLGATVNLSAMPVNTTVNYFASDPAHAYPYIIHTYPNTNLKTITFYHNDASEHAGLDNYNNPATSLVQAKNIRGNYPQNMSFFGGSSYQQPSMLTVANITNWNSITSIKKFAPWQGDGINPVRNLSFAQDFMQNNKGFEEIVTSGADYGFGGYRDLNFKISRLKSNWNTYFTELKTINISEDHWDHEDLSALTKLSDFILVAARQGHENTVAPPIPITVTVLDNVIKQIAAGAGQYVSNGRIILRSGGTSRSAASDAAYNFLISKGWTCTISW